MNRKILVMHIISDSNFGGAGNYLKSLCSDLNTQIFDIAVALPKNSALEEHLTTVSLYPLNNNTDKSFSVDGTLELFKLIQSIKPDVVHTHGSLSGRIAAQLAYVPKIVYTKHTISPIGNTMKKWIKGLVNRVLRSEAIAISHAIENNLLEEGFPKKRIHLIYNGIHSEPSLPTYSNTGVLKIALVGRMEAIKGHNHMIAITALLKAQSPVPFVVQFVGIGSLESSLKKQVAELNLPIEFIGFTKNISTIYKGCDIVVNTSNSEALCYVALEGMSHGRPVVAFDLPGINEVIVDGETGYLVPYLNYQNYVDKLIALIQNRDLREKLGQSGYLRVKSHFDSVSMVKSIENIYLEVL